MIGGLCEKMSMKMPPSIQEFRIDSFATWHLKFQFHKIKIIIYKKNILRKKNIQLEFQNSYTDDESYLVC